MGKELIFSSDYIEILTNEYDTIIYTPVYSEKVGLYLSLEGDKPIKDILLFNSNIIINYIDGKKKLLDISLMSVTVNDTHFKRRTNTSICGTLFKYTITDAQIYELEVEKSVDYKTPEQSKRKRSI